MERRDFLKTGIKAGLTASVLQSVSASSAIGGSGQKSPNILLIMSDEHNANLMGCANDPYISTPNLDRLADKGILFSNCYCNSPLCCPSRLSFTAGKYVSRIDGWGNTCMLESNDVPSIASTMKDAGYDAYLCGKMHYDKTRDYNFDLYGSLKYEFYHKTGFGESGGGRRNPDDLDPLQGISSRIEEMKPGESWIHRHDRSVATDTIRFLENRRPDDKPFFFMSGFLAPHFPLIVPEEYLAKYRGKIPLPELPEENDKNLPLNYKHLQIGFNVENLDDETVTKARELYYGLTDWFDGQVGSVLDALEDSSLRDNTIVIYTSDHGEMMGEHGLWWKNCMYEGAAKVPLIVSWPERWAGGQRRTEVCSLLDVVQTVLDLGGARTPGDWDGDSLRGVLDGKQKDWKNEAVSEYYGHHVASGYVMLRKDNFKYVYHTKPGDSHPAEQELYDLDRDPDEHHNLAGLPAYQTIMDGLQQSLLSQLPEHPEETEKRCREDYRKGYNRTGNRDPNPFL